MKQNIKYDPSVCLNCQTSLKPESDHYCPNCGQRNLKKRILLKDLLREFLSSLIAYDSRLQKSLTSIVTAPGKIALDYIHGKRARYVNPFRMFISIALIFFIFFNWFSDTDYVNFSGIENSKVLPLDSLQSVDGFYNTEKVNQYIIQTDSITYTKAQREMRFDDTFMNYFKFKFMYGVKKAITNEQTFYNYIIAKLPFLLFFFLPVFTLLSRLFYLRKNISYTEHLIFNFYQQSIFFIFLTLGLFIAQLIPFNFVLLFGLFFSVYNVLAYKKFYQQSTGITILKAISLNILYAALCLLALFLFLIVSLVLF